MSDSYTAHEGLVVRAFRDEDLESILEIERSSFGEPYGLGVFRRLLTQPNIFLIGELGGRPVAYILGVMEGGVIHVVSVAVSPEWRRRGFAKKLFQQLFFQAETLGRRMVILEVDVENLAAQKLYLGLGFYPTERIERYYTNGHDALVMAKQIA